MLKTLFKPLKLFGLALLSSCFGTVKSNQNDSSSSSKPSKSIYEFKMEALDHHEVDFAQFKGKKILLVNVASECGFTPQYEKLQKLHELHGDKVVVVGFPANNFGGQEPGSDEDIGTFCKKNYGVTFLMMSKISVKGHDAAPLYNWLSDKTLNGWNDKAPSWNFCKYLISEKGELLHFYGSSVDPLSKEITNAIEN